MRAYTSVLAPALGVLLSLPCAAADIYEKDLKDGLDVALMQAFGEAVQSRTLDEVSVDPETAGQAVSSIRLSPSVLQVSFDEDGLTRVLGEGVSSWDGVKEPVVLWLVDVSSRDGSLISQTHSNDFVSSLSELCRNVGVNILSPVMDLDDVMAVNDQTVLQHNDAQLVNASGRYGAAFFVAGGMETGTDGTLAVKLNVYDKDGRHLGEYSQEGAVGEIALATARTVTAVLRDNYTPSADDTAEDPNAAVAAVAADPLTLGPGDGFVRIGIYGTQNLSDLRTVKGALITYGYESDTKIVGYLDGAVVFEIPTAASPAILDGTIAHAGEFTKTGDWLYSLNQTTGAKSAPRDGIMGGTSFAGVTSVITPNRVITAAAAEQAQAEEK